MTTKLPLSDEQLRHYYKQFLVESESDQYLKEWIQKYRAMIERVQSWRDHELRRPEAQKELWTSTTLGGAGAGKSVSTARVYDDIDIVTAIEGLRAARWTQMPPTVRAIELQRLYEAILDHIHPRLCARRPKAKLKRVFLALRPDDFHRGFDWESQHHIAQLVLGSDGQPPIKTDVLVRARLREVLGQEPDPLEHTRRSFFCWWLHNRYDTIKRGTPASLPTNSDAVSIHEADDPSDAATGSPTPPIELEPFAKQRKGILAMSGYLETVQAVLRHSQGGATTDEIVESIRQEPTVSHLKAQTCRQVVGVARFLSLIEQRDGRWYPSEAGEATLAMDAADDVPPVVIERFLRRVFGMAQLLRALATTPLSRQELMQALLTSYSRWTTDFAASAVERWASALGLIERGENGKYQLSELGQYWHDRLPERLPAEPASRAGADLIDADDEPGDSRTPWTPPSFAALWDAWQRDGELRRFIVTREQLRMLHLAWHAPEPEQTQPKKRFAILSGLSGTGKTKLLIHYARLYCKLLDIDFDSHHKVIAVSPDWRDPSGLLGYVNALRDATFMPAEGLDILLRADRNRHEPFFLILDEMNLAHVERYFAPFLSAMETGGNLVLHGDDEHIDDVPPYIPWLRNLFISGTVNMDETTHPFSDKVLDRAFTLELWDVDLASYCEEREAIDTFADAAAVHGFLIALNAELARIRRHVGYRAAGEVLDLVRAAADQSELDAAGPWPVVDHAVHAKVLPRLRGHDSPELRRAIETVRSMCNERNLAMCTAKLALMLERLDDNGTTRFFG